jgi:hypothetical protein
MRALVLCTFLIVSPALVAGVSGAQQISGSGGSLSGGFAVATVATAISISVPPELDGRDDDAVWRGAPVIDAFRQFHPAEDGEPSFRTEARLAYDARNLYVLVRAFDPHPDSILPLLSRRDVRTNSDQIKVVIDAYRDRRTGVSMIVNPAGVKRDASIFNDLNEDLSWDGVWDAAARIDSLGWVAEFRIPFSQLRFSPGEIHTFGFGIWRDIARRNERVAWPAYFPSRQTFASQLGELQGLRGIERGSRFELLPYVVAKNGTERTAEGWSHPSSVSAGADLKVGLTSSLTLDATVNPDFGQVEADPAVLNLTAFEIRFDERRPFFQEGVGLFRCGGPCEGIFYTRRIGRAPQLGGPGDPTQTTIAGAAKLTGRFGKGLSLGLVEAVTLREEGRDGATIEPRTNYLVGRAHQELRQGRSGLGVMVTAVHRDLDQSTEPLLRREAYTGLVQGFHRFAGQRLELMGYHGYNIVRGSPSAIARTQLNSVHLYQRPDHEEEFDPARTSMSGSVSSLALSQLGGSLRYRGNVRYATPGGEMNDLGFVTLVNDLMVRNNIDLQIPRPRGIFRRFFATLGTEQHWTTGGLRSDQSVVLYGSGEFRNSWNSFVEFVASDLFGAHCVPCARGGPAVRQSPGWAIAGGLDGDPRYSVIPHLAASYRTGDEGRTSVRSVRASVDVRIASRFSLSMGPELEARVDDQQWVGNFGDPLSDTTHYTFARLDQTTVGMVARANYTATPNLSFQLYANPFISSGDFADWRELADARAARYADRFVSYGTGAPPGFNVKQFNSNVVARWEYRPGSTLYVVWQHGRRQQGVNPGSFELARDYRDLFRAHPENTLLVKLAYWLNP